MSLKVNLGCGVHLVEGFINVDKFITLEQIQSKVGEFKNAIIEPEAKFVQADAGDLPFRDNSIDYIESIDMIEHIPFNQVVGVFAEIARVLKPSARLCMMTTNFDDLAKLWLARVAKADFDTDSYLEISELIYGNQVGQGEFHNSAFNPWVIRKFILDAGLSLDRLTMYPQGSINAPEMQTIKMPEGSAFRSAMMWVQAHKRP